MSLYNLTTSSVDLLFTCKEDCNFQFSIRNCGWEVLAGRTRGAPATTKRLQGNGPNQSALKGGVEHRILFVIGFGRSYCIPLSALLEKWGNIGPTSTNQTRRVSTKLHKMH